MANALVSCLTEQFLSESIPMILRLTGCAIALKTTSVEVTVQ
jgi:hypothetical protein